MTRGTEPRPGGEPGGTRGRGVIRLTPRRADWAVGGIVAAVYAVVQLLLLQGPRPHDPALYFQTAAAFPDVPATVFTLRIGLIAPVHAAVVLLGPSEAALYVVPFASGVLLAGAVYGTTLVLFGDRVVAVAAALVVALNGYHLLNSSFIFPDTAAAATFAAGFLCLVLGGPELRGQSGAWAPRLYVAAAGVLLGWTYLIREFSLVLVPVVLAAALLLRYGARRIVLLAAAAFATFLLEPLYGLLRYGDPFVHARTLLARRDAPLDPEDVRIREHVRDQLDGVFETLAVFPRLLLAWSGGWVFVLLAVVFLLALTRVRDRRLWILAPWCFGFWAFMAVAGLGSLPSGQWILNITNIRYWYPVFPPLVMGAFGGAALLARSAGVTLRGLSPAPLLACALAALAVAPGMVEYRRCAAADAWHSDPIERWHDLRSWFASEEAQRYGTVLTDLNSSRFVPPFTRTVFGERLWHGTVERLDRSRAGARHAADLGRSLLLVHKGRFRSEGRLEELRREWSPVFVGDDGVLVVLAHESAAGSEATDVGHDWWRPLGVGPDVAESRACRLRPYAPDG